MVDPAASFAPVPHEAVSAQATGGGLLVEGAGVVPDDGGVGDDADGDVEVLGLDGGGVLEPGVAVCWVPLHAAAKASTAAATTVNAVRMGASSP